MLSVRDKKNIRESLIEKRSDEWSIVSVQFRSRGTKEYVTLKWKSCKSAFDWHRTMNTLIGIALQGGGWIGKMTSGGGFSEGSATFRLYPPEIH